MFNLILTSKSSMVVANNLAHISSIICWVLYHHLNHYTGIPIPCQNDLAKGGKY
jgi:hypothetical protein